MLKTVLITSAVIFTATNAYAGDKDWYASGQFGVRAIEKQTAMATGVNIEVELDNGTFLSGAIGKSIKTDGLSVRVEGEIAWRGGNLNSVDVNGVANAVTGDGFSALSFMANGYIDFENGSRFTPYLGAGLGLARITGDIQAGTNVLDGTATAFAFQGIAGVDLSLSESASVFTDLRYFNASGTTMTLTGSMGSGDLDTDYDAFTVGLGLRLKF